MYMTKINECASAGADGLTIKLASGLIQRDGTAMTIEQFPGIAMFGVTTSTGVGTGSWPSGQSDEGTTVSVLDAKRVQTADCVQTAVRVRPLADVHVPGSPARGAPV